MADIFEEFNWHSSIGIDKDLSGYKRFYSKMANTKKAREMFITASDSNLLIHKTTQALWRVSEDGKAIEPVFDTDVLTDKDISE
jgi:hypothetical protein